MFSPGRRRTFFCQRTFVEFFSWDGGLFQHLKRYFYIYPLIFIELNPPPKKKYSKQNLPHTQRPTILTHLLKQTRQTTTTQPNNIITLPIPILKNHRKHHQQTAQNYTDNPKPYPSKMKNQHHEAQNHHIQSTISSKHSEK